MNITLCTSPHLNHSIFHDRYSDDTSIGFAQLFAPMGLISIASAVDPIVDSAIFDINKAINSDRLPMSLEFYDVAADWLLESNPDMVGFMTEADSYHHVIRILQKLKEHAPKVMTLLGGVHATAVCRETLAHFTAVDFIIRGEGELAFRKFIDAFINDLDFASVGNLTYRDSGQIRSNPELPLIQDLDTLPWPDCSRIALTPDDALYIEVGRGCPFKCSFCFTASYWHRRYRIKTATRILGELLYFRDHYNRTDFNLTHDLFTTDRRWVLEFCRQLVDSDIDATWTCSSRTDTIDEEQIHWMARAGCRNIYFGVEAGTAEMQTAIQKRLDLQEARQTIAMASEAGIEVTIGFIAGLPGENLDTLNGTLSEAFHYLRLPNSTVHLFGFSPYPGSPDFTAIQPSLSFDPHFLEFPLPGEMRRMNCDWMQRHFEIFARYSRLPYEGLDVQTIQAAEELFPIVNGIPRLFQFVAIISEPVALLRSWATWIARLNRQRGRDTSGLYQGTIEDFLEFLSSYLEKKGQLESMIVECIRWESMKRATQRIDSVSEDIAEAHADEATAEIFTNPSVSVEQFRYTPIFLGATEKAKAGTFAFYKTNQGETRIARLPSLGILALQIAASGVKRQSLITALSPGVEETMPGGFNAVSTMLEEFERIDLIRST